MQYTVSQSTYYRLKWVEIIFFFFFGKLKIPEIILMLLKVYLLKEFLTLIVYTIIEKQEKIIVDSP